MINIYSGFQLLVNVSILSGDLNQMHRINEESYRNPVFKNGRQTQNVLMRNGHTPGVESMAPISHRLSGIIQSLWLNVPKSSVM